jgi:hypothetical protein
MSGILPFLLINLGTFRALNSNTTIAGRFARILTIVGTRDNFEESLDVLDDIVLEDVRLIEVWVSMKCMMMTKW